MPATATTPSASYPYPLPDAGTRATEWALNVMHGSRKSDAWITTVIDINQGSEWLGNHYVSQSGALTHRSDAGHYVCIAILKEGSTKRVTENVEAVAGIVFDDVGDMGDIGTKMDIEWFKDKPEPTFIVETSHKNFQFFFVFDEPADPGFYMQFVEGLKANPATVGGIKDGATLTRYVRLPSGQNPKADKGGFKTRLTAGSGIKYSLGELEDAFGAGPDNSSIDLDELDAGIVSPAATSAAPNPRLVETSPPAPAVAKSRVRAAPAAGSAGRSSIVVPGGEELRLPEAESLKLVEEILDLIKNEGIGREDWVGIVFGAWVACGRNDAIKAAIDRFTDKWKEGVVKPDKDEENVWDRRFTANKAGVTTLIRWLEEQDTPEATAMRGQVKQIQAKGTFEEIVPPPAAAGPEPAAAEPAAKADPVRRLRVGQILAKPGFRHAKTKTIIAGFDVGEVTLVGGPSGAMKSLWVQQAAVAIITGKAPIIGENEIDYLGDVVFYANEDAPEQVIKRVDGIMRHHRHKWPQPRELHVWTGKLLLRQGTGQIVASKIEVEALERLGKERKITLVVVDTLAAALVSEETNLEFQLTMNLLKALAIKLEVAIAVVHHFRKGQPGGKNEEPTLENLRGGSTLTAAARNVLFIEPPGTNEAKEYGISDEADRYMKLNPVKRSYGARGGKKWFEREVVDIETVDPRNGAFGIEDAPVLVPFFPSGVQHQMSVVRDALTKLAAAGLAGKEPRVMQRGADKQADSVERITGLNRQEAARVVAKLIQLGVIVLVSKTIKGNDVSVLRILSDKVPETNENGEDEVLI